MANCWAELSQPIQMELHTAQTAAATATKSSQERERFRERMRQWKIRKKNVSVLCKEMKQKKNNRQWRRRRRKCLVCINWNVSVVNVIRLKNMEKRLLFRFKTIELIALHSNSQTHKYKHRQMYKQTKSQQSRCSIKIPYKINCEFFFYFMLGHWLSFVVRLLLVLLRVFFSFFFFNFISCFSSHSLIGLVLGAVSSAFLVLVDGNKLVSICVFVHTKPNRIYPV